MLYPLLIRDFPDIIEDTNDAGFCYAAETYSSVGLGYESHYDTPEENRVDGMVYAAFCLLDAYYNGDGIRAEARYYLTKKRFEQYARRAWRRVPSWLLLRHRQGPDRLTQAGRRAFRRPPEPPHGRKPDVSGPSRDVPPMTEHARDAQRSGAPGAAIPCFSFGPFGYAE